MGIEDIHAIFEKLSPRQVEVFVLLGKGKSSGEIAGELGISEKSVYNVRYRICQRLDLEGRGALYHLALKAQLEWGVEN
jgi:DNA-binding CsgD family transcriptional regulator